MKFLKLFQKCILFGLFISLNLKIYSLEPIKLVTGNDFSPFTDEKLKNGGMYTSVLKSILKKINLPYKIEFYPWARGYEMLKKEKFDVSFPYAFTKERSKEVQFSKVSLVESSIYIYTNIKYKNKKNINELKGTIFCSPVGYYIEDIALNLLNKNELKKISKFDQKSCIEAVINNEANFVILSEIQMKEYKKQKIVFFDHIVKIGSPINKMKLFLIYRKNFNANLIKKIDSEAINFKKTNEYKDIINSY